jgi:hypothetical protein
MLLCRLYEAEPRALSNSYALESTFVVSTTKNSGDPMRGIAAIEPPAAGNGSAKPGFWHRLALAVDAYLAQRTKKAVPTATLRRSKHEVARCRRLIRRRVAVPINVLSSPQTRS